MTTATSKFDLFAQQAGGATSPILCLQCSAPITVEERRTFSVWRHTNEVGFVSPSPGQREFAAVCAGRGRHEAVVSRNEDTVIAELQRLAQRDQF